jgi:hypothetical protein
MKLTNTELACVHPNFTKKFIVFNFPLWKVNITEFCTLDINEKFMPFFINLSMGKKVLMIDADPQPSLSSYYKILEQAQGGRQHLANYL